MTIRIFWYTDTYSVTFASAIVMEILTYLTFLFKDVVACWFKKKDGKIYRYGLIFKGIWLILFL